ncbi:MAG: AAA family ATPase, partial [Propionibacteriaceae bacterium]|nr:AAA family ATPase [Propionibacteriaceae bacterium]
MSPVAYRLVRRAPSVAEARPDDGQARVVGHGSGPLLVLGGPGSGKTWALVEAVAARLGRDDGHVVVLTHDAGSAARLRDRLAQRAPGAGRARVTTWAGLSLALVDRAEPRPRLIGAVEQDVTLRELIAGLPADVWPAAWADARLTKGFARQAGEALALLRREGVGPGRLAAAGRDQGKPEWVGLARLAREYFAGLALAGAVDFPGLLERAIELAGEDQDAARWGDLVGAFYIDHYEEVEPGHLRLLSRLAGPGATVVAFGDPRQSVGSFRGAAARSILDFPDLFPGAEVVE